MIAKQSSPPSALLGCPELHLCLEVVAPLGHVTLLAAWFTRPPVQKYGCPSLVRRFMRSDSFWGVSRETALIPFEEQYAAPSEAVKLVQPNLQDTRNCWFPMLWLGPLLLQGPLGLLGLAAPELLEAAGRTRGINLPNRFLSPPKNPWGLAWQPDRTTRETSRTRQMCIVQPVFISCVECVYNAYTMLPIRRTDNN